MRYFDEKEVKRLANPEDVIQVLRAAFARDCRKAFEMPLRSHLDLDDSVLLLMPCYDRELGLAGVKIVTAGMSTGVTAVYSLVDAANGSILALMEANYLTDLRTGAVSAIATDLLARQDARVLGIFGSGRQAFAHLVALSRVRHFQRFLVCGSGRSDTSAFRSRAREELRIDVEPVDPETCVRKSEVICTCTTSPEPLFDGRWLQPGTHLNLVGAFQPHTREVDSKTIQRSKVVVDTYEGCMNEAGDLLIPIADGVIDRHHVLADLHEITAMKKSVRTSPRDITLFKSVGCALEDLVAANLIYRNAG